MSKGLKLPCSEVLPNKALSCPPPPCWVFHYYILRASTYAFCAKYITRRPASPLPLVFPVYALHPGPNPPLAGFVPWVRRGATPVFNLTAPSATDNLQEPMDDGLDRTWDMDGPVGSLNHRNHGTSKSVQYNGDNKTRASTNCLGHKNQVICISGNG